MVIGVTGNFGVGKTTVAKMFRQLGTQLINADDIAHSIIQPHTCVYRQIIAAFGKQILAGVYISRKRLGDEAFSDAQKLKRLNKIMHPAILRVIKSRIKKIPKKKILIIDAALLIESGLSRTFPGHKVLRKCRKVRDLLPWIDKLVVVKCKLKSRIRRLKKQGLAVGEIRKRLSFQLAQAKKINFADFIVDNSGRRKQTEKQVKEIWDKIGGTEWKN